MLSHGRHRFDMLAIHHDIAIALALEQRNHLHAEAHFRRPETGEILAPEQMLGDTQPTSQLLGPVGFRDQGQYRVIISGAENIDDIPVLKVPEQRAAIHHTIDVLLKLGIGQGFQQTPRQRDVHPGDVFIGPEKTRNTVVRIQNLARFPWLFSQKMLEIAGGLVEIQNQGMVYDRHGRLL